MAVIGKLNCLRMVPKTRSGKIMRRVLRAIVLSRDPGDVSTIEDEGSIEEAREVAADAGGDQDRSLKLPYPASIEERGEWGEAHR